MMVWGALSGAIGGAEAADGAGSSVTTAALHNGTMCAMLPPAAAERATGREGEGGGSESTADIRRGWAQQFLIYVANAGGLHPAERSAGAAAGSTGGPLSRAATVGSSLHSLLELARLENDDEIKSKRYALLMIAETQTKTREVEVTKRLFREVGYETRITRGVSGAGTLRPREERRRIEER